MATALRDYSQSREQEAILEWAEQRELSYFLDIGAGDGETFSNSRALAQAGWRGVCVEPAPWAFERLSKLYANEYIAVAGLVVTADYAGPVQFHHVRGDHLSTLYGNRLAKWPTVEAEEITLYAIRLSDLLDQCNVPFSFVSIDTEGTTMELLRAYQRHPLWAEVECICVEIEGQDDRREVEALRARENWKLRRTANNAVLWR